VLICAHNSWPFFIENTKEKSAMIIARSPLRITLGGGGTDVPSYYREYGGFLVSAAIDKYVYVTVMRPFIPGVFLKYSKLEHTENPAEIEHPIIREAIQMMDIKTPQLEITTLADIPAGTGLGSSGSFTTALLKALYAHQKRLLLPSQLAQLACEIEINRLGEPIGKQDQYIAAYGGITSFHFHPDERVSAEPMELSQETLYDLEDNLLLFFTKYARKAGNILKEQDQATRKSDPKMIQHLHEVKELGLQSHKALKAGDTKKFAELMHVHWEHKKKRSDGMTNSKIDEWYKLGCANGAIGGKLVGAGGGGFLMFYAENKGKLREVMRREGLEEVRFRFDFEGTRVLLT
jgi:D-glycero-alpha-D-manno-heptose-7-phosphate kinase